MVIPSSLHRRAVTCRRRPRANRASRPDAWPAAGPVAGPVVLALVTASVAVADIESALATTVIVPEAWVAVTDTQLPSSEL